MEMRVALSRGTFFCWGSFQCKILFATPACFPLQIRNGGMMKIMSCISSFVNMVTPGRGGGDG